jgi:hypothetical protein
MTLALAIGASLAGVICNFAVQIGLCRAIPSFSLLKSLVVGFAAGAGVSLASALHFDATFDGTASALVLYGAAGYCYFHFVNMGETARRIRLLRELQAAPGGRLSRNEMLARYSNEAVVVKRIERLIRADQLRFSDGRYRIGAPAMHAISRLLLWCRILVFGRPF